MHQALIVFVANVGAVAWAEEAPTPGSPGCLLQDSLHGIGVQSAKVSVDGLVRTFTLYVPPSYRHSSQTAFWLLAPGAFETAARFLHVSQMAQFAEEKQFAFAVLQSTRTEGLNVGLHGQALPYMADDVAYTRAVLRDVSSKLCVNMDRIHCAGFSRGGRFCSRLASEMSSFLAGIAPVAGLRFPSPNNASKRVPIITLHGTNDRINPYWGKGDPSYWNASVPDAAQHWADFNRCKSQEWSKDTEHIILSRHFDCADDASVVLVMVEGDGHTWAGSEAFLDPQFGRTTKERAANEVIWNFFSQHPVRSVCHTAQPGEQCFTAVNTAIREGPGSHPEWGGVLTLSSTFEEYQAVLHYGILADCPRPCGLDRALFPPLLGPNGAPGRAWRHTAYRFPASVLIVVVCSGVSLFAFVVAALFSTKNANNAGRGQAGTTFLDTADEGNGIYSDCNFNVADSREMELRCDDYDGQARLQQPAEKILVSVYERPEEWAV